LVGCADVSRTILSNDFSEREYAISYLEGLYMSVGPGVAAFAPDADETINAQLDSLRRTPDSNIIPGATLVDTFDRLIDQVDNPTSAPTPDPTVPPTTAPTNPPTDELPTMDIPTTALEIGFTTLVTALSAANSSVLLANPPNPGPLTVFAPSNEAFANLGADLTTCLFKPENVLVLQDILTYHYTYGKVLAEDLTHDQVIMMANGKDIKITIIPGGVIINDSSAVTLADVLATNGVIHAIDNVLVPPGLDVTAFREACLATDPPVPAPITPLTPAPQPEPTRSPTTKKSKSGKGGPKKRSFGPVR